jgi:hypothetical protein
MVAPSGPIGRSGGFIDRNWTVTQGDVRDSMQVSFDSNVSRRTAWRDTSPGATTASGLRSTIE